MNRELPIHTPADTYISAAYYFGKAAELDEEIVGRLEKAAVLFDIVSDFESVRDFAIGKAQASVLSKTAAALPEWAIETATVNVSGTGCGSLERFADSFLAKSASYCYEEREELASEILLAARAIGAEVPAELRKYAAEAGFDAATFSAALGQRATILNDRDKVAMLSDITPVDQFTSPSSEELRKAASFLNDFDTQYGLTRHYGRGIIDPHSAIWSVLEEPKTAELVVIGGVEHELSKVAAKLPEAFEFATSQVLAAMNGEFDRSLLSGLTDKQAEVINQIL